MHYLGAMELVHRNTSGRLPTSTFVLRDDGEDVGFVQIRHRPSHADDIPPECASHIYYEVREDRRQRGYGTTLLALGLQEARRLGLTELIVCCFESNPASKRVIEKNGGHLAGIFTASDQSRIYKHMFNLR